MTNSAVARGGEAGLEALALRARRRAPGRTAAARRSPALWKGPEMPTVDRASDRRVAVDVDSQLDVGFAASDVVRAGEGLSQQRLGVARAAASAAASAVASAARGEHERGGREREQRDDRA